MKKNQAGFGAVEAILLLVIIIAIAGIGYYVYKAKKNTTAIYNSAVSVSTTTKPVVKPKTTTIDPYAGWNTYTLPKEKLTFRYPTTWTVSSTSYTDSSNDGVRFTSKSDSNFEILIGAGQSVAAIDNYDGNCVNQADNVTFAGQKAYLDLVGFADTNAVPPSCTPASSTIQEVLLSGSSTTANVANFFLTKNIAQPASPAASEIVVKLDYDGPNDSSTNNKTINFIENDADYKDAKLVVNSLSY